MKTSEQLSEKISRPPILWEAKTPYLDLPELSLQQKDQLWRQLLNKAPLPFLTRWILYRSLRTSAFWS